MAVLVCPNCEALVEVLGPPRRRPTQVACADCGAELEPFDVEFLRAAADEPAEAGAS